MNKNTDIVEIKFGDENYPKLLKEIQNPPPTLFARGVIDDIGPAVAIVGTRRATQSGIKIAENIAYDLGSRGFTIISGLAIGIDTAAHAGALRAGARTIAVLGNGLNKIYPAQNANLAEKILETGGAIISEYGMVGPSHKGIFLNRNRIISGLSLGIVFVEVPIRSGAVNTASWAGEQGRSIFVIPGPTSHPNYAGSHKLIRDGGTLVTGAADILEDLGYEIETKTSAESTGFENAAEKLIFETIKNAGAPITIDDLIESTDLDADAMNVGIATLVIQKSILETPNGYTI